MTNDDDAKPMLDYNLRVRGVWGRKRKEDREIFKLARVPVDQPIALDSLIKAAEETCREIKLKPGARISIGEYPIKIKTETSCTGTQYEVVSFLLCADKTLHTATWEG